MMTKTLALGAAIASLMVAGAALAQNASGDKDGIPNSAPNAPTTVNPMPERDWTADAQTPTQNSTLSATQQQTSNDNQARTPVNADVAALVGVPVDVVTNGPVPDTRQNRAKYGSPDSHAGKLTKPAGN